MRRMAYDITKHSPKKHFLQKYDFLLECKFNYLKRKLFIRHYFSRKPCLHSSEKLYIKQATYDSCDSFMDKKIDI